MFCAEALISFIAAVIAPILVWPALAACEVLMTSWFAVLAASVLALTWVSVSSRLDVTSSTDEDCSSEVEAMFCEASPAVAPTDWPTCSTASTIWCKVSLTSGQRSLERFLEGEEVAAVLAFQADAHVVPAERVDHFLDVVQRRDDRVERLVDALDDLAEVALMLGGVGAGGELALHRRRREHVGVGDQRIHGVDAGVEVVLDGVEVAVVAVGDLGRDRALGDLVDIIGGDVQRPDDRVERVVHALDDLAEVALVLGGVGAGGELALHGGAREHVRRRRPAR